MFWTERLKNHVDSQIAHPERNLVIPPTEPIIRELNHPQASRRKASVFQMLVEQGKERQQALAVARTLADAVGKLVEKTNKRYGGKALWEEVDEALATYERINTIIEDTDGTS